MIQKLASKVNLVCLWFGMLAMLMLPLHVALDIFFREYLGIPIIGTIEIASYYYMIAIFALPLAFVQEKDGHLVADVLEAFMSKEFLNLTSSIGYLFTVCFLYFLFQQTASDAWTATKNGEYVELVFNNLYIWPSRWIIAIGFGAMFLQAILQICDSTVHIVKKRQSALGDNKNNKLGEKHE